MGYYTWLSGEFSITPPLTPAQAEEIEKYVEARHEPEDKQTNWMQMAPYCQWFLSESDDTLLPPEESTKNYEYVKWLEHLIAKFFAPWGCTLDGACDWRGDEDEDRGTIYVKDNVVEEVNDVIMNPGPSWAPRSPKDDA